ncbi:MSHA biogenesis protein MshF [Vibrio makurazakiensis]|uniref:MSHA biogenesis protein MshF n=1 Tax=Vibrio makurazakiensis TaxID=2910250 RepID=UPI003D120D1B
MAISIRRPRMAVWGVVILFLIFSFLGKWRAVEMEALNTSVVVASKRILERANYYKQHYLLGSKISEEAMNGSFSYSKSGWLIPTEQTDSVCKQWLTKLYPEQRILNVARPEIFDMSISDELHCRYEYTEKYQIDVLLSDGRFSVKVNMLAL